MIPLTGISAAARLASARVAEKYMQLGYGPGTPAAERDRAVRCMRAEGATKRDCADVFGISSQLVQQILRDRYPMYVSAEEAQLIREHRGRSAARRG